MKIKSLTPIPSPKGEGNRMKNEELRIKNESNSSNEQSKLHSSFFILHSSFIISLVLLLCACGANNCPLESKVTCNYGFYDAQGTSVKYNDTITVTTLKPGMKTIYTYRKLGYKTVVLEIRDSSYIKNGYTETVGQTRRDTILVNNLSNANKVKIPMSYFSDNDTIIFAYNNISNRDTIYIAHDSYSNVELPECGTHRFHHLKTIRCTNSGIDHIDIVNPEVNYEGNENVKIYFMGTAE